MPDLKDLKQAILEIPKLVELLQMGKQKFNTDEKKFKVVKTKDGKELYYEGETPSVGLDIFLMEGDKKIPCPVEYDGEYGEGEAKFTVKSGKIIDAPKEAPPPAPDFSAQMKALKDTFDKQLKEQKENFDKEIAALKADFNTQATASKTVFEAQNKILKDTFEIVDAISKTATVASEFKKKDGEPVNTGETRMERITREAAGLSKQVFKTN